MKLYDMTLDPKLCDYALALDASPDYRVLRRLPRSDEMWLMPTPAAGTGHHAWHHRLRDDLPWPGC